MAEEIIKARVWTKIDTLEAWDANPLILGPGEFAPVLSGVGESVFNFKVGTGDRRFSDLPWSLQTPGAAVAADTNTVFPTDVPGLYIPTEDGTYEGVTVDLSVGYVQLIWDGTTLVKVEFPIDLNGYATVAELTVQEILRQSSSEPDLDLAEEGTESGYIAKADGALVAGSWITSDYIPVEKFTKVTRIGNIFSAGSGSSVAPISFWDDEKNYLGSFDYSATPVPERLEVVVNDHFPAAKFIRTSSSTSDGLETYINANFQPTVVDGLVETMYKVNQLYEDVDFALDAINGYYDASGNAQNGSNWRRTARVPAVPGSILKYLGVTTGSVIAIVGWDVNNDATVIVGTINVSSLTSFVVPDGIVSVAASARMTEGDSFSFVVSTPISNSKAEGYPVFMPEMLYAQTGKELRLNPFGIISKRGVDVVWSQEKGNELFLSVTPPDTSDIEIELKYRNIYSELKSAGTTTIKVSDTPSSPASEQFFITLGDSTTLGVSAAGIQAAWPNECSRRLTGIGTELLTGAESPAALSLSNISFIGTIGDQPIKCEGRGGWGFNNYLNSASVGEVTNAFWNPSTESFDLDYYISQNGFTGIDSTGGNLTIIIQLGWNHVYRHSIPQVTGWVTELIDLIHAARADCKVKLLGIAPPPNLNVKTYEGTRNVSPESIMREAVIPYSDLYNGLSKEAAYSGFVEHIPIAPVFFPDNSYPYSDVMKSLRDSDTIRVYNDYVHPNARGYAQIADAIFNMIIHQYCQ